MRILHLEDSPEDAALVGAIVRAEWPDCEIIGVDTRLAFVGQLRLGRFDIVLSDFNIPSFHGPEALALAKECAPDTPFIFLSGTIGEDWAIEALRAGAEDYVHKDRMKRLITAIARAVRERDVRLKRKHAEHRIRELAEYLDQAREAVFVADLNGRITFWNAGAERLFGWPAAEVMGRAAGEIFDATAAAQIEEAREVTLTQGLWIGEMQMHGRGGAPLVVESRQSLIRDESGRPKACLCINTDITDRRRLEEQFLRAQRMENIGLLAAGIAHDLNNMLSPILLAAPMLRDHVFDSGALAMLTTLEKSAERGANLVRQILAFAQGASGEKRLLQVKHLLRDVSSVMAGTFPKSIRLEDSIPSDLWPITGNPTQVHQILLNLCINARDAMPNGGILRLSAENRILDLAEAGAIDGGRPGMFVILQVEDTGTGIPPDVLAHIWEPFFTTKATGKGTGLGLSTARGIIENHHGFVSVSTSPGRGSVFRVYIPAVEGPQPDRLRMPSRSLPRGKGELILVVDDERSILEMTLTVLTRSGYRVILAADGAEAVAVFGRCGAEIRLVITDIHMPNLDGATLGRVLRRMNSGARLLAISGMASSFGNLTGDKFSEFADGFLYKPFKPDTLLAKVQELLPSSALDDRAGAAGANTRS